MSFMPELVRDEFGSKGLVVNQGRDDDLGFVMKKSKKGFESDAVFSKNLW